MFSHGLPNMDTPSVGRTAKTYSSVLSECLDDDDDDKKGTL